MTPDQEDMARRLGITKTLIAIQNDAYERAALIAEQWVDTYAEFSAMAFAGDRIASTIRALKELK